MGLKVIPDSQKVICHTQGIHRKCAPEGAAVAGVFGHNSAAQNSKPDAGIPGRQYRRVGVWKAGYICPLPRPMINAEA